MASILYFYLSKNIMRAIPDLRPALRSTIIELDFGNNLITNIDWNLLEGKEAG